ncbi:MAG: SUMF1/EgtB/PvdO family nonheme iron enzyme [Planctomycetales bacterium]|nr:SUMF1/EgtB/PvdO family nonheme iron enzyme [Planctomycetales bacterium]
MAHAHQLGVVHRDLKPNNILVSPDGTPKLLDFGIAKALETTDPEGDSISVTGESPMTPSYASPEQLKGQPCTLASDVYSLGLILFELLSGSWPYSQKSGPAHLVTHCVLSETPLPPSRQVRRHHVTSKPDSNIVVTANRQSRPPVGIDSLAQQRSTSSHALIRTLRGDLDNLTMMAIQKDPARRYTSAQELLNDIERYFAKMPLRACGDSLLYITGKLLRRHAMTSLLLSLIIILSMGGLFALRSIQRKLYVSEQLQSIIQLRDSYQTLKAFHSATELVRKFPANTQAQELLSSVTADAHIDVDWDGTEILYRPAIDPGQPWRKLGVSPYQGKVPIARLHLCFRNPGHEDVIILGKIEQEPYFPYEFQTRLKQQYSAPERMQWVPANTETKIFADANKYTIQDAFYIDRYEVTNLEFQEFIQQGGYETKEYWPDFFEDGQAVLFEDGIDRFRNAVTHKPAPSTWTDGKIPVGLEEHPVHGISWYEAAAYAKFRGKSLPTIYHWYAAAATYFAAAIVPQSNFASGSTVPVGKLHGIGPFGTEDMAGNVCEWCTTKTPDGFHFAIGGMWSDQGYMYADLAIRSPFSRAIGAGIRCVKYTAEVPTELAADRRLERPNYEQVGQAPNYGSQDLFDEFYQPFYDYDRDDLKFQCDFNAQKFGYPCIRITYKPAYETDMEGVIYLFLPDARKFAKPFQAMIFFPGASGLYWDELETIEPFDFQHNGRVTIYPVYWGISERRSPQFTDGYPRKDPTYDEAIRRIALDYRRSLDIAEQLPDLIDSSKIAYYGYSWGAGLGPLMLAIDNRCQAAVLHCGGVPPNRANAITETSNFFPYVRTPTLMVNCKFDAVFPKPAQEAMFLNFRLLDASQKKYLVYDTDYGHCAPREGHVIQAQKWMDQHMGIPQRISP